MRKISWFILAIIAVAGVTVGILLVNQAHSSQSADKNFDANRAYQDLISQVDAGPRIPGTPAHDQTAQYIQDELGKAGWQVEVQQLEIDGHSIKNVIAKRGSGLPLILLGAHYDTRMSADRDPDPQKQNQPVPGANDGASGVAVLLELSRVLPAEIRGQIWLVFFDAEDQGNLPGWDWILGSRAFVDHLQASPDAVVIVDMVGDKDLGIYEEINSTAMLRDEIWNNAKQLSYQQFFIPKEKYPILDDHTPFKEKDIPAVDIIDFVYPYWHTTEDTIDKVSPESLKIVGDTLLGWILPKVSVGKN